MRAMIFLAEGGVVSTVGGGSVAVSGCSSFSSLRLARLKPRRIAKARPTAMRGIHICFLDPTIMLLTKDLADFSVFLRQSFWNLYFRYACFLLRYLAISSWVSGRVIDLLRPSGPAIVPEAIPLGSGPGSAISIRGYRIYTLAASISKIKNPANKDFPRLFLFFVITAAMALLWSSLLRAL